MLTLFGAWRNMVARLLWEQEVAGSNPVAPTINPSSDGRPSGSVRVYDDRSLRSLCSMLFNVFIALLCI
jgi:hypothetical protein